MYIKTVTIENFKGIEKCQLSFKKGFNLIIGENGKGKTSILEAISIGISGFLSGIPITEVNPRQFSMDEVRTVYMPQGDGAYVPQYNWPQVCMTADINGKVYSWSREKRRASAQTTTTPRDICHLAEKLVYDPQSVLPVISYQSAARVWAQKRKKQYDVAIRIKLDRSAGYIDCVSDESSIKTMLDWCSKMEQIAWQKGKPVREYEAVKKAVSLAMGKIECQDIYVFYDKQSEELLYQMKDTVTPISMLSAGYQSLIWMIFDIAYRMAVLNPAFVEHICEAPGLVLIDELDVHLHPRWQWQVIDVLRYVFPNVQFIATTHSPIIIASAKNVWCINIENMGIPVCADNVYGLEVNYILKNMQHAAELPKTIADLLKIFYQKVDMMNFDDAEAVLATLQNEIGENNPIVIKAKERLDLELAFVGMEE